MSPQDPRVELIKSVQPYPVQITNDILRLPEPEMLVEGFLPKGAVLGITASPGVGKTWLVMELMRSAVAGGGFLGKHKWSKEVRCLFVGSDASMYDYARQWRRLIRQHYGEFWEPHDTGERGVDECVDFLLQSDFMLDDPVSVARLIQTAQTRGCTPVVLGHKHIVDEDEEGNLTEDWVPVVSELHGYDVIVFDTLSRLTRADQNDNTEMENVFRNIRFIAEQTGAACILLHHNSKRSDHNGGEDWRGAVAQIGALDCWLQLSPLKNDKYVIKAEFKKFRGITPEPFMYRMDVNGHDAATLTAVDDNTKAGDNFSMLTDAMYKFIVTSPTPVTAEQIHEGIWSSTADLVHGNRKLHLEKLANRLQGIQRGGKTYLGKELYKRPCTGEEGAVLITESL